MKSVQPQKRTKRVGKMDKNYHFHQLLYQYYSEEVPKNPSTLKDHLKRIKNKIEILSKEEQQQWAEIILSKCVSLSESGKEKDFILKVRTLIEISNEYEIKYNEEQVEKMVKNYYYQKYGDMSAEVLKQMKIKTSMLRRLRKQYESYEKETKNIQTKIQQTQQIIQNGGDGELQIHLKKNKEFLNESQSVLSNVKQKLIEAFEGLVQFLSEKGDSEGVKESEQKNAAQNMVLEVQTFLESLG